MYICSAYEVFFDDLIKITFLRKKIDRGHDTWKVM
jgi:hypothetical protein